MRTPQLSSKCVIGAFCEVKTRLTSPVQNIVKYLQSLMYTVRMPQNVRRN